MMMTRTKLYVTLRSTVYAVMALCGAMIAGCNDQLLPPEQSSQTGFSGRIFFTAPMPLSGEDVILAMSATDTVPDTIAMGRLVSAPQQGRIAYYRMDGPSGVGSVYVRDIDDTLGISERSIYSGAVEPGSITLAPDGLTVGFLAYAGPLTYELHVITSTGVPKHVVPLYNAEIVTFLDEQCLWLAPDGDAAFIASLTFGKGGLPGYSFYAIDPASGGMITSQFSGSSFMTGVALSQDFQPAVTVTGTATGGNGLATITTWNNSLGERFLVDGNDYYHSPAWSPDGENIAFTVTSAMSAVQSIDIYTISTGGFITNTNESPLRRITFTSNTIELYTDWSPDGSRILFTEIPAEVVSPDTWQTGRLVIVDPQTRQTRVIADNAYKGFWSRD